MQIMEMEVRSREAEAGWTTDGRTDGRAFSGHALCGGAPGRPEAIVVI
jgi:hypothetical protein